MPTPSMPGAAIQKGRRRGSSTIRAARWSTTASARAGQETRAPSSSQTPQLRRFGGSIGAPARSLAPPER
jgi:hypothetical protein